MRRALLTQQSNPGSRYRGGRSTYEQPVGHARRERSLKFAVNKKKTILAGRPRTARSSTTRRRSRWMRRAACCSSPTAPTTRCARFCEQPCRLCRHAHVRREQLQPAESHASRLTFPQVRALDLRTAMLSTLAGSPRGLSGWADGAGPSSQPSAPEHYRGAALSVRVITPTAQVICK